jgi:hypothetical protein
VITPETMRAVYGVDVAIVPVGAHRVCVPA